MMSTMDQLDSPTADHSAVCSAMTEMLAIILALPDAQRGPLLRYMFGPADACGRPGFAANPSLLFLAALQAVDGAAIGLGRPGARNRRRCCPWRRWGQIFVEFRASGAGPRRSASASIRTVRMWAPRGKVKHRPASLMVGLEITTPAMRTLPAAASFAASVRVRQNRACQSHLSRRWLARSFRKFEIAQGGERRIGPVPWRCPPSSATRLARSFFSPARGSASRRLLRRTDNRATR